MLPLSLPQNGAFGQPPRPLPEGALGEAAKAVLDAKEAKNRQELTQRRASIKQRIGEAEPRPRYLANAPTGGRRRSSVSLQPQPQTGSDLMNPSSPNRVQDFPFLNWGAEVQCMTLKDVDFLGGLGVVPVHDRKLVKLGILAARSILCMQHADIVLPEVLLADFASVGSGCVLLCEERSRVGNLGIQPEIMPNQRQKALEALSLEFHLDLSSFLEQQPSPCTLLSVDMWDTVTVRSHLSGNARKLKRAQERMKRNLEAAAASQKAALVNTEPEKSEGADDEIEEEEEEEELHDDQSNEASHARMSAIDAMLKASRVSPLQLLRKLLNTTEDPEGPLDQTFPNPKKVSHRFVTAVTNTVHLLPTMYPIGVRNFSDFLLRRFRPEFLRVYCGEPLVSTACYASCPKGSTNSAKLNCFRATLHLFNHVIPACAATLDLEAAPLQGEALCSRLHMFGVNLRYLGWVLPWVTREDVTRAVLTEITARSYKKVEERRDKSRHERLTEALLAHAYQMQRKGAGGDRPPAGGPPPPPEAVDLDGVDDDAEDVEFAELTRIAVNKFYPPHLWVPLPRLFSSELKLLGRMHPKYGIVMDVLEGWGQDDPDDTDATTVQAPAASEVLVVGGEGTTTTMPSSDGSGVFAAAAALMQKATEPKVWEGVDFSLHLDAVSVPPTPHVEAAYEYDTVLHPSVIDSKQVEVRILDLVRRQRFVFLPGRYTAIALETYISQSSSACLERYFQFLQASILQRHELSQLQGMALSRRTAEVMTDFSSHATTTSCLKHLSAAISGHQEVSARLLPLLKAAGTVAFALYPFEASSTLHNSGGFYLQLAVQLGHQHLLRAKMNARKHQAGELLSPRSDGGGDRMVLADPVYWVTEAHLAQAKFYEVTENDQSAIVACNEGLQVATNPRQRIQLMLAQVSAHAKALQRAALQAPKASFGVSLEKRRRRNGSDDEDDDDGHSQRSGLEGDIDDDLPPLSTSRSSVGGSSHTRTTQDRGGSPAPSGQSVQPLLLDILRTVPASLPPRHPARDPLYKALLMTLDSFLDREMIGNTMHMLSPTSSQSGSIFSKLAAGGSGGVGNMSIAEGSVKDDLGQFITERNFASSGVPLECLGALKAQRDDYLACHLSLMRVTNFVSPMAMRFNFDDSKFPELSSAAGTNASTKRGGDAPTTGGDSMIARNDAMTLIDAFLGTDREGLRYLEDRSMLIFTCLTGKSSLALETTRNILDMRKMNAHSLILAVANSADGAAGGGKSSSGPLNTPGSEGLMSDTDDTSNASPAEMSLMIGGGRQMGVHDTLWATERRQGAASSVPRLPLCGQLPIVIDCKMCEPYDDAFLLRALPGVPDTHLKVLAVNPKLLIILDGYNPQLINTCETGHYKNYLSWAGKKILLVDDDALARMSPTDLAKSVFAEENSADAIRASSMAVGYAVLPWSKQHIFKALQRLEMNQFWDNSLLGLRDPMVTKRNASNCSAHRWHVLNCCAPRLVQFMSNPRLASIVGAAVPLLVESSKHQLLTVVDGRLPGLRVTMGDVLDCAIATQYLGTESSKQAQVEALMYAITMATLMSQTAALFVRYEECASAFLSSLPIRRSRDGTLLTFVDPVFISYFLSLRSMLELLESEDDPGACIGTMYGAVIVTKELALTLKRSGLRRSKSVLAAHAIRELLKIRQQGATVMKAVAKFSEGRKKRLNGGEWLTSRELSIESDVLLIDFLSERCATVPAFRSSLIAFGLSRSLPEQARLIVPNALTILSFARYSFSGASLRGVDLSGSNVTRLTGCALDGRCTKWNGVTARNANLAFSDFTSADFRALDIGSEPKLELLREGVTITTLAFPASGIDDVVYTGDESGRLVRWKLDTGIMDHSITVKFPIAKLALNPSTTLIALACAETNPTIEIREAQGKLRRVAQLINGHSARVTSICFSNEFELLSAGFDWQVLVWELPQGELQSFIEPVPVDSRQSLDDTRSFKQPRRVSEAAALMFSGNSALSSTASPARSHVSPKRQGRLAPLHATVSSAPAAISTSMSSKFLPSTGKRSLLPMDVINATQVWSGQRGGKQRVGVAQSLDDSNSSSAVAIDGKRLWFHVEPSRVARKHHVHITALDCTSHEVGLVAFLGGDGAGAIFPSSSTSTCPVRYFQCEEVRGGSCVRFSRDGAKLAIPSHRGVTLLDANSGRPVAVLHVPTLTSFGIAHSIDLTDDGAMLAAVCDRTVCIWDVVSGHLLAQTSPHSQKQSSVSTTAGATTSMLQGDLVASTGFTRRGKALLSTFWGGGVKVMPLVFNDRRDQILTENAEDNIPTVEYRWLLQVNGGAQVAGVGFQGRMDLIDNATGTFLGTFGTLQEEATLACGDLHSDMIAVVCPPRIILYSVNRRQPCTAFMSGARLITAIAFSPHGGRGGRWTPPAATPSTTALVPPMSIGAPPGSVKPSPASQSSSSSSSGGFAVPPLLIGCSADRIVRVWSCDSGALVAMFTFDASISHLVTGEQRMLALTGVSTSRSLSIATLDVSVFPPLEKKRGGAGKLFTTPQGDMIIRLQRIMFMCARKRYQRQHHYGNIGVLLSSAVLPFLRRMVDVQLRRTSGIIRFPHREVMVRCAIGGPADRLVAVSFDQFVSLWSVDHQATHVRTQEVHEGLITSIDLSTPSYALPSDVGALMATTSSDGCTMVTATASGSRVVVIRPNRMSAVWCARFHRAVPQPDEPASPNRPPQLLICGSDGILRRWDLSGAPCVLGTRHPIAKLGESQFAEWLEHNDLAPLVPMLRGKLGADLMDMTLDEVVSMLLPLVDVRRRGSIQRRRSTVMGSPLLERRPSMMGNYSSSPTRRGSSIFPSSPSSPAGAPTGEEEGPTASAIDVERLRFALRRAREQSYETTDCSALDDGELTGEQFDTFTPEQLAAFFDFYSTQKPQYALLAAVAPLILDRRPAADAIRKARTMGDLRHVLQGTLSVEDMANSLYHEVSLVRNSRLKQSFLEKPFADIVLFSRTKSPATQFLFQILGLSGKELLDRTQFPNQLIIQCPDCGRKIADARMTCPVRKGNHTHLTPELDSESATGMARLANTYREHINTILDNILDILRTLPDKVRFSCGMWWHPMIQDPGLVSVLHFDIPKLTASPTTVVNNATISISVTDKTPPRMVVLEETHPKLLQKLAGISSTIGTAGRASKLSFPAPPGWKKAVEQSFDSAPGSRISSFAGKGFLGKGNGSPAGGGPAGGSTDLGFASRVGGGGAMPNTKYSIGEHSQMLHPTQPTAALSYMPDEVVTTITQAEVLTTVLAASIMMEDTPKPHHRFRRQNSGAAEEDDKRAGGMYSIHHSSSPSSHRHHNDTTNGNNWVTADVKDVVNAAIKKGQSTVRILVIAESIAEARELTCAAVRPVLSVNYYDEQFLCACNARCVWFPQKPQHLMPELAMPTTVAGAAVTPPTKTLVPNAATATVTMGPGYVSPPSDTTTTLTPSPAAQVPSTSPFILASKQKQQAAAAAAAAQAPVSYFSATKLCDRFCNVDSRCRGHKCPSSCAACRKAPFMVWETREAKGGSFYHANISNAIHLSAANKNHIKLRDVPYVPPRDSNGPSLQRKLISLNNITGVKGTSATPTSAGGAPGNAGDATSVGGADNSTVSPLMPPDAFSTTPAPTSLLLPPSNARQVTPSQELDKAGKGIGTPMTANSDNQGRRKTVTITSFESELQKRGL